MPSCCRTVKERKIPLLGIGGGNFPNETDGSGHQKSTRLNEAVNNNGRIIMNMCLSEQWVSKLIARYTEMGWNQSIEVPKSIHSLYRPTGINCFSTENCRLVGVLKSKYCCFEYVQHKKLIWLLHTTEQFFVAWEGRKRWGAARWVQIRLTAPFLGQTRSADKGGAYLIFTNPSTERDLSATWMHEKWPGLWRCHLEILEGRDHRLQRRSMVEKQF